ncbi:MAG: endonuclease/exonuclease/phosphatase family protein [Winogradskyella sp.]
MKGLKLRDKLMFIINSLAAFLLLMSYILQYIPPKTFAALSVLSLSVPLLLLINILFFIYWLFKLKKQLLLSLIVLGFGYRYINAMYKFSSTKGVEDSKNISIMTYNVRLFNLFNWLPSKTVKKDIINFIKTEQPDILCIQEYHEKKSIRISGYHKYQLLSDGKIHSGQAIFSKLPIINSGSVKFQKTSNNAIFIDVVKDQDTLRVYNLHLQSSGIDTNVKTLNKETSSELFNQVSTTFIAQQTQAELFNAHKATCNYKVIIAGDFNNTAYSYVYKELKGDLIDTFETAGEGFGRTYDFKFFPVRIDFILVDDAFNVNTFKTYNTKLSDHYPIKAILNL